MKRKDTFAALMLSISLVASPAFAAEQASEPTASAEAVEQKLVDQKDAEIQKAAEKSRKIIVANVEGQDISMFELVRMMNRVASAYYADVEQLTPEIDREIRQRALDRLIFEELAVREAVRQDMKVDPEKIDKVVDETRKLYPSEEEYQKYLADIDINEEQLRARIERRRLLQGITGREVYQKVTIDEKDVDRLYQEYLEAGKLKKADEFFIKEIFILEGIDPLQAKATADKLLKEMEKNGHDFGKLILDGTFIVRNLRVWEDKLPVIYNTMKTMQVDEFSGVVEDGGTFHIFKVLKNEPGKDMSKEEARNILEDRLGPYSQEKRRVAWVEELRKDAKITIYEDKLEEMAGKGDD